MMDKNEIIERLGEIAKHAVHIIGEEPFIMSLDDGTAVREAIDIIPTITIAVALDSVQGENARTECVCDRNHSMVVRNYYGM